MSFQWTSEAVSSGHPDKVADQIADTVLDCYIGHPDHVDDRVACEVTCTKDKVILTGEISNLANEELGIYEKIRSKICSIGYFNDKADYFPGWSGEEVEIIDMMNGQSPEIAGAITKVGGELGAGDQGIMFGYACDETENFMPLAHTIAFDIIKILEDDRADIPFNNSILYPDAKSQVTIRYLDSGKPVEIETVVISTSHISSVTLHDLRCYVLRIVVGKLKSKYESLITDRTKWIVNPAGTWNVGGPKSDTGLSGRKIVVDNYGADCPIGGGSFSGKDPTKVDRSAAYAARYVAKNIVASGLAKKAQVQLSYAIGVVEPVSLRVQTFDTGIISNDLLTTMIWELVDLTPKGIIDKLNLKSPIYAQTASGGHFGRLGFPWESLDLCESFREWG